MIEIKTDVGEFTVEAFLKDDINKDAISIAMVTHLSPEMTRNAVASFKKFSEHPIEIYLVDNFSPPDVVEELKKIEGINLILNRGEFKSILNGYPDSVLNGVGIDIASRFIKTRYMFTCHNDVLAYKKGWLTYLKSKLSDWVAGAAFGEDNSRIKALHISGCLIDLDLYEKNRRNWYPNWNSKKEMLWDVGDHYTKFLRDQDFKYYVCGNTHNDPSILDRISDDLIEKHQIHADKAISEEGDVLYLHLGRGITKFAGIYNKPGRTTYKGWIDFGNELLNGEK